MKTFRSRLAFDEFKKKSSELLLILPSEMMRVVLENAQSVGKPDTVWINQDKFESVIMSVTDHHIFSFVYREDTHKIMIYCVFVTKDDEVSNI